MASSSSVSSLVNVAKRLKLSPPKPALRQCRTAVQYQRKRPSQSTVDDEGAALLKENALPLETLKELRQLRLPRSVQATYLAPLKREPKYYHPSCDLQLRSYNVSNLEVFADFCLRAAYYLNLPATGPAPLPRMTERWTVPKSNFVHKKSQENFERRTVRRLIRIYDGHPETVAIWLAYIQQNQYFGVGMKANVWEHSGLEVGKDMDKVAEETSGRLGEKFELFGRRAFRQDRTVETESMIHSEPFKGAYGAYAPLGGAQSTPHANQRVERMRLGVGEKGGFDMERLQKGEKRDSARDKEDKA